ncbi:MAG: phytoene desaturase, partial [Nitratireductor sp.]|nr:phytoene desaturase [Nitratireductor sp.]
METSAPRDRILVIGAGMGGLSAAISLAASGREVLVLERADQVGGKARNVDVGGMPVAAGPTVLTMKWVFEALFEKAGADFDAELKPVKAGLLARHRWTDGSRLDLFADIGESAAAIEKFSDRRNADGYRRFCAKSAEMFATLKDTYIAAQRPGPFQLMRRIGLLNPARQLALMPLSTLWGALGTCFPDQRLRQLFARYATYCGSSPFLAPATLMLVAHVEQDGVWLVDGGIHALAHKMQAKAERLGVQFRFGQTVEAISVEAGRANGVVLENGERVRASAVIFNGDASALAMMDGSRAFSRVRPVTLPQRSLSARTWCLRARVSGFPLAHHTVFFSPDYAREFDCLLQQRQMPNEPTTYLCAQDRDDAGRLSPATADGFERLLFIVNAAADGDMTANTERETRQWLHTTLDFLEGNGLKIERETMQVEATGPAAFSRMFPGSGGALYGRASHGWTASFRRPGARTALPGLYLAGGSVHPGPGVPMATLSGMLAAESLLSDRSSTARFRPVAISGGMPT